MDVRTRKVAAFGAMRGWIPTGIRSSSRMGRSRVCGVPKTKVIVVKVSRGGNANAIMALLWNGGQCSRWRDRRRGCWKTAKRGCVNGRRVWS